MNGREAVLFQQKPHHHTLICLLWLLGSGFQTPMSFKHAQYWYDLYTLWASTQEVEDNIIFARVAISIALFWTAVVMLETNS
jgi:hypothetical protein